MTVALTAAASLLGLVIGSFLNVVIWRVPRGESVVSPPSHCPACDAQLRPRDNIPVLSWVLLRGRCRHCAAPISKRYPLVETLTAVVFAVLALRTGASWDLPAFLYLGAAGVALALIDVDVRRLPNAIVYPSYPVAAVLLTLAAVLEDDWTALWRAAAGGAALLTFYFTLLLVYPPGMGLGDVKLSGLLGIYLGWLGWGALVVGAFAGFLVGGLGGVLLMLLRGASRKSTIPFGPYMLVGVLIGVLFGSAISDAYLDVLRA